MNNSNLMMGTYTYNLDAKNRVFIPAKHRDALGENFGIFPNIQNNQCLIIATAEYLTNLIQKITQNEQIPAEDRAEIKKYLSGFGDTLTPDAQGRVVLSANLVSWAGLGGPTVIRGCHDYAELWNATAFQEATKADAERYKTLFKQANIVM